MVEEPGQLIFPVAKHTCGDPLMYCDKTAHKLVDTPHTRVILTIRPPHQSQTVCPIYTDDGLPHITN